MNFLKRIGYYLIGVSLGSIVVLFIWKGKDISFDYGPNARTLKSIRSKQILFSKITLNELNNTSVDSVRIKQILKSGKVNFSKSKPRIKPCAEYLVESDNIDIYVRRCDSVATIEKIWFKK